MITVLLLGILGGLDNLQIGSAIGLMGIERKRRWVLVAPFIFFDVGMTLVGLLIGNKLNSSLENIAEWLGPGIMMAMGIYTLVRELMEKEKPDFVNNKWFLLILPLSLSFDNLFAGLGLGTAGYPVVSSFIIVAICSGGMCLLGLIIGAKLRSMIPPRLEILSSIYLIGLAIFLVIKK